MIEVKGLNVQYQDKKVLTDLSVIFPTGSITGLVAPNGTGKSTLLNTLMNYVHPSSGTLTFGEDKITYRSVKNEPKIHQLISLMPDQSDLYDYLSGLEHLTMYQKMWSETSLDPQLIIEKLHMSGYVKKKVAQYSLGMRQRLCFAMQLVANTRYMLMDEVMNGLDPTNVELISQMLLEKRREGKTILLASHLLENLEKYSDTILFLRDGGFIYRQEKETVQEQVLLFPKLTPGLQLWQKENQLDLILIPNGKVYLPLTKQSATITVLLDSLLAQGITDFSLGHLPLADRYSLYYE
ncbi:ABC transporter ATP-binding protein [Enterococcus durans]|uniref:ABC transporter ATP-binding protein n=1 Tax=Enterococcus durans TaxID=53345 RepID=UPI003BDE0142